MQDLKLVIQSAPDVAHAFLSMHRALRRAGEQLAELDDTIARAAATEPTPYEEVRDFFHYIDNYIHELDVAAESWRAAWAKARATACARWPIRSRRSTAFASSWAAKEMRCAATIPSDAC